MSGAWSSPVPVGAILAGKYRVERVLGVGGMGAVVAATHIDLDELRAIKLMHASESESAAAVERFLREARAVVKLKSEYVAAVYDVGRLETGVPYIVMEYLEGNDLSRVTRKQGPLPIEEVVHYMLQACDAISEAHALGIVHRDLKPANLFLTRRDDGSACIKVLDFGISKHTVPGAIPDMEITSGGEMLGSPHYMAPEQMRSAKNADVRADLWSLGAIMYRLITGRLPFPADTPMELAVRIVETVPERPSTLRPELSPGLEAVILGCLEKDPDKRIQSATELASMLLPFAPVNALELTPLSRRLVRSIAPPSSGRASLHSMVEGVGAWPVIPGAPALPNLPNLGADAGQTTWPSLPTSTREPATGGTSAGTAWGATDHSVPQPRPPARSKVLIAAGAGALLLAVAAGVALSLSPGRAQQAADGPPAGDARPTPAETAAAAPAPPPEPAPPPSPAPPSTAEEAAAPAQPALSTASTSAPAATPAKAATTATPRGTGAPHSGTRPGGSTSDPFGRSRK